MSPSSKWHPSTVDALGRERTMERAEANETLAIGTRAITAVAVATGLTNAEGG